MIVVYRTRVSAAARSGVLPRKILLFPVNTHQVTRIVCGKHLQDSPQLFPSDSYQVVLYSSAQSVDWSKEVLVFLIRPSKSRVVRLFSSLPYQVILLFWITFTRWY
jgi:hypothetical protein